MRIQSILVSICILILSATGSGLADSDQSVVYPPPAEKSIGQNIVFLTGDEEYRSEEGLPMMAKILSQHHGFHCTVLFAVDPDGTINSNNTTSVPGIEALDTADAIVMLLRFRNWPDEAMKHFAAAYERGVPIIALRTSTHAFKLDQGSYQHFNDFGKRVLGEQWVSHWGKHKAEATRGVIEPEAKNHPMLNGVGDIFGDTDVYEAHPPEDATILVRGQVLSGMKPKDPPATYSKKRVDGVEQPINDPMMPVAWTRTHRNETGKDNFVFCTTMGAATDLKSDGLRRLIVNAVYAGLDMAVPEKANVDYVGDYNPTDYGFDGYRKGVRPSDHALGAATEAAPAPAAFKLDPGDHIALVGSGMADRMQHFGWLETFLHAHYPTHKLVVRNLAVAGDEVATRHRSEGFGTPDEWLSKVQADVVLAFLGFNECFQGPAGLENFKGELGAYLEHLKGSDFSGKGPPRVLLITPMAMEDHPDPNFPDPAATNENIRLYSSAMLEVAKAHGVRCIELFEPSQALFAGSSKQGMALTLNGLHLTEEGDREIASILYRALVQETAPAGDLEKLRAAVNVKNAQWHARYRTVDGFNVYGGRSHLAFPTARQEVTNRQVMQEEMNQRDVLTANRDALVWSTAQGKVFAVDDSNLPAITPVATNKPGDGPDQSHTFLSGEAAIEKMEAHDHCTINLFASEEMFPELINPVQMAWDTKHRLWVSVWPSYPERTPTSKSGDSLIILEDTDGDGRADKSTTFLDDLNCPTGFQFFRDGVLVMQAPDLWFVRDTDGDGRADSRERILMGMDSADSHHTTNSMVLEPGGAVYLSDGIFHRTQVETPFGPVRNIDGGIFRFEPRTARFERYVAYNFMNPHGRVFDAWGNDFITDATGNLTYFAPAFSGKLDYPHQHPPMQTIWQQPSRPSPGTGLMTSRHFPEEFWGNLLNLNVIGFQGIYRVKLLEDGSGIRGDRQADLIASEDPNFRPTAVNVGPDGAVYFADWHNPIIGHMQHHIRDPNRDHAHGRIYRLTYNGRALAEPTAIDGQPIEALLELLKSPENQTRELAKIELGKRETDDVMRALDAWIDTLDLKSIDHAHHLTEALWLRQWHNRVDPALLKALLESPEPRARAAATRVLCYWRDGVADALELLRPRAIDEHPRVRLEAIRAASFFGSAPAAEIAVSSRRRPADYYLDYALAETIRQLQPHWKPVLLGDREISGDNPAGRAWLVSQLSTEELLAAPPSPLVLSALLGRPELLDKKRHFVTNLLGQSIGNSPPGALLHALQWTIDAPARTQIARLLPQMLAADLKAQRQALETLTGERTATVRHYALAALATAYGSYDAVWSDHAVPDLLQAVPLTYDPFVRATAYERLAPIAERESDLRPAAIRALASVPGKDARTATILADLIEAGQEVAIAASSLMLVRHKAIDPARSLKLAESLLQWSEGLTAEQRTEPANLSAMQFAESLIATLPAKQAGPMLSRLRALRVPVFIVNAVREQMRYDIPRLVVEAGKPFEITLVNNDMMPHNLVITQPGERERVGTSTMTMKPSELDAQGRAYVPADPAILAATTLVDPGQRATLTMTAPSAEGAYDFLCTYPDHWRVMFGTLIVTRDVESYLLEHPIPEHTPADADHLH